MRLQTKVSISMQKNNEFMKHTYPSCFWFSGSLKVCKAEKKYQRRQQNWWQEFLVIDIPYFFSFSLPLTFWPGLFRQQSLKKELSCFCSSAKWPDTNARQVSAIFFQLIISNMLWNNNLLHSCQTHGVMLLSCDFFSLCGRAWPVHDASIPQATSLTALV